MRKKVLICLFCMILVGSKSECLHAQMSIDRVPVVLNPCYTSIVASSGSINKDNGRIKATVSVTIRKTAKTHIKMQIQKKEGSTWTHVQTWNRYFENQFSFKASEYYSGSKGSTYRMKYTIEVGADLVTKYTSELKL